jgi:hypothetical protein
MGRPSNEENLIYFLHIPKTSGTSVSEFLNQGVSKEATLPPMLWDHLVKNTYRITSRTRVVTGHFAGLLPLWLHRWPSILTVLRDPLARALSHINHVQRESAGHPWYAEASSLSIEQFCEHPVFRRCVDNLQARHLASLAFSLALVRSSPDRRDGESPASVALAHEEALFSLDPATGLFDSAVQSLGSIYAFGIAELQGPTFELFKKKLGWSTPVQEYRTNVADPNQKRLESLTASELDALTRLNSVDQRLYACALEWFRKECNSHGVELLDAAGRSTKQVLQFPRAA